MSKVLEQENRRLREALSTYGDHRFKCAVRQQLRADDIVTKPCDCGWQDISSDPSWR